MVAGKVADLLPESRLGAEVSGGDFAVADKAPYHGGEHRGELARKADKVIDFAHSRGISGAMSRRLGQK